jgi:exopolyphosphatase/pppGpp-phosphohydrolase
MLARLDRRERRWPVEHAHGYLLGEDGLLAAFEVTSRLPATERAALPGIAEHRVDSIVAGALVVACLLRATGATAVRVSGFGLREGIAWGLLYGGRSIADVRKAGARGRIGGGGSAEGAVARAEIALRDHAKARHVTEAESHALALALRVAALGAPPDLLLRTPLQGYLQEEVLAAAALLGAVEEPVDPRLQEAFEAALAIARVAPPSSSATAS